MLKYASLLIILISLGISVWLYLKIRLLQEKCISLEVSEESNKKKTDKLSESIEELRGVVIKLSISPSPSYHPQRLYSQTTPQIHHYQPSQSSYTQSHPIHPQQYPDHTQSHPIHPQPTLNHSNVSPLPPLPPLDLKVVESTKELDELLKEELAELDSSISPTVSPSRTSKKKIKKKNKIPSPSKSPLPSESATTELSTTPTESTALKPNPPDILSPPPSVIHAQETVILMTMADFSSLSSDAPNPSSDDMPIIEEIIENDDI